MYVLTVTVILLLAIPGLRGCLEMAKGTEQQRSKSGTWCLALLTIASTAILLVANHLDLLF